MGTQEASRKRGGLKQRLGLGLLDPKNWEVWGAGVLGKIAAVLGTYQSKGPSARLT